MHAIIPLFVSAGPSIIDMTLAPEFPWSAFAVAGRLIALLADWRFGSVKLDDQLTGQQQTEARAAQMR